MKQTFRHFNDLLKTMMSSSIKSIALTFCLSGSIPPHVYDHVPPRAQPASGSAKPKQRKKRSGLSSEGPKLYCSRRNETSGESAPYKLVQVHDTGKHFGTPFTVRSSHRHAFTRLRRERHAHTVLNRVHFKSAMVRSSARAGIKC